MKKYILYNKNGEIKSISNGKIGYDKKIFTLKQVNILKADTDKMDEGFKPMYNKGKIKYQETEMTKKQAIKKEIEDATTIDELKNILNKII